MVLKRKYMVIGFLAFCLTAALFIGKTSTREVKAESTPTVYLGPPSVTSGVCQNFTVDIRIRDLEAASHLYRWDSNLFYSNIILETLDYKEGPFLRGFEGPNGTLLVGGIYQDLGFVAVGGIFLGLPDGDRDGILGEEEDWPYGTGVLATVTFHCTQAGECVLELSTYLVRDTWNGTEILHQEEDGYVRVLPTSAVDLNNDGIVDIGDIVHVALAFGAKRIDDPEDPRYGEYWHDPPCPNCPHH